LSKVTLTNLFNSRAGTNTALWLGKTIPPRLGYPLANILADFLSHHKQWSQVQAVTLNQWIVHNRQISGNDLDQVVRECFRHAAYNIYEFYHTLQNPKAVENVILPPAVLNIFNQIKSDPRGWIFVAPHLGNVDLMGRAIVAQDIHPLVLSVAQPPGGYQVQNKIRKASGLEMAPASMESLRLAAERLRSGGLVLTGADRPLPDSKYSPRFFGIPARLPVVHIKLALRFKLPIYIIGGVRRADRKIEMFVSDPIPMETRTDPDEEVLINTEAVLKTMETNIRQYSTQWNMSLPVWPDIKFL